MPQYLSLAPILLLSLVALAMFALRLVRARFAFFWLGAALGALIAWPLVMVSRLNLPYVIPLGAWQPAAFFASSPQLIVDGISWPFAAAVATLTLAVILTDVARSSDAEWSAWAGTLTLGALGLFAVQGANTLTVLLAWAAIDIVELFIFIRYLSRGGGREQVVLAFFARTAGIILLLWPSQSSLPALLAVGLRLGVLPPHMATFREPVMRRGLGTMVRLVPAAASLAYLARLTSAGLSPLQVDLLLALTGVAALLAGLSWLLARNELDGRPFWISSMAALAIASTLRGQPLASLAWGVALLFSGGLLFLTSARSRPLIPVLALGLLGFSTLPFTPAWDGARLYSTPFSPVLILFLVAHVLLLAGYIRHMVQPEESLAGVERWVLAIYPLGLVLLPLTHFVVGGWGWLQVVREPGWSINILRLWPAFLVAALTIFLVLRGRRSLLVPTEIEPVVKTALSLRWLYRGLWGIYDAVGRLLNGISRLLEGEGGVLWALLILALILAFFVQAAPGVIEQ
jgi:hypothetical protein